MDIWSSLLISTLLLLAALGLMCWHIISWRKIRTQPAAQNADDLDFYRRQFRRRIQTTAMLGILAAGLFAGELLPRWIDSRLFLIIYWVAMMLLVLWMALLAAADIWATKFHFSRLSHKFLIEQAKLKAEIQRVQSLRGNGKPMTKSGDWPVERKE
jgi:hypothetical protein